MSKKKIRATKKPPHKQQTFKEKTPSLSSKQSEIKSNLQYDFIKQSPVYRYVFFGIAVLLFLIIPFLSYDAGISGDEELQQRYGEKVYAYFNTFGEDTSSLSFVKNIKYYGALFDLTTYIVNKLFNVDKVYEVRHILNGLTGWATIVFTGLLATFIAGWRAGIITMLLLFFSPRFLGHSFNNPKDIPFALGYIFTLYYIIKFLKRFPKPPIKDTILLAVGIAIAISVRIGGLLLVVYLFLFAGLYFLSTNSFRYVFSKQNLIRLRTLLLYLLGITVAGYFLGLLSWPYALEAPFKNPINALMVFSKYSISLRQLFEGTNIWSGNAPWYYLPKYIFITTPVVIHIGILLFLITLFYKNKKIDYLWKFILLFAFIFPIAYIIYKHSNVYGGWRHVLFVYPPVVILSAIGFDTIISLKNKVVKYVAIAGLIALLFNPIRHTIYNHPHQYIFYNKMFGGVKKANGYYEMDYYYHTLKEGAEWLINNINTDTLNNDNKLIIAVNHGTAKYYFRNYKEKIQIKYVKYYDRGNYDWDYYICANTLINAFQLQKKLWPPKNTSHTVNVDEVPVCAIIKREDKHDYLGSQALKQNNIPLAQYYLERAIGANPANESALLNLIDVYYRMGQFDKAVATANQCLKYYKNYERALHILGMIYMNKSDFRTAIQYFNRATKANDRFYISYYFMGVAYNKLKDNNNALQQLTKCLRYNNKYKPAYTLIGNILKQIGKTKEAQQYFDRANKL